MKDGISFGLQYPDVIQMEEQRLDALATTLQVSTTFVVKLCAEGGSGGGQDEG